MTDPARSFDRVASEYEQARPGYPTGILDVLPIGASATVLDLGAGTGKLTRVLVGRYERVIAVEPLDRMRAILEQVVPAAESHAGTAEAIPLPEAAVDGVFAAQAFHWFANDVAVAEIARVLRPGGVLALVWNESRDPSPLPEAYRSYFEDLHTPSLQRAQSDASWAEVLSSGPFGELSEASVGHEQEQERDDVLGFVQSMSWIAHRPEDERAGIMRNFDGLLPQGPFVFPLVANVHWAVRV